MILTANKQTAVAIWMYRNKAVAPTIIVELQIHLSLIPSTFSFIMWINQCSSVEYTEMTVYFLNYIVDEYISQLLYL